MRRTCHIEFTDVVFPSVCSQVTFKTTSIRESFITMAALMSFLPTMWPGKDYKILLLWEIHIAIWLYCYGFSPKCVFRWFVIWLFSVKSFIFVTIVWLLSGMFPQMPCTLTILCEILPTLATLVWLLPSMYSQMPCKLIILCEILVTMATLVWLSGCFPYCVSSYTFYDYLSLRNPCHRLCLTV